MNVPYFRPLVGEPEVAEVTAALRSGWLTTGPRVQQFEKEFAASVNANYAVSLNSCTAALHLAVEALNLRAGCAVLVPTMTFAATAEIVRYMGAIPILVDCDPINGNMDLKDAARKLEQVKSRKLPFQKSIGKVRELQVVGIIPVHVGGMMLDMDAVKSFAVTHNLWLIEDAAHAFPAAWRRDTGSDWQKCGDDTAIVSCFSFYANKTITTGEGGMAITNDPRIAEHIRLMSLHGLSHDSWGRYSGKGNWDYRIVAPGYKYNMTDIAAAIGIHQLARAEEMRCERERIALTYIEAFRNIEEIELPPQSANRIHSWHLFPLKLRLERLNINRNEMMEELKGQGVGCSVHWRPLHLHPYYQENFGWDAQDFPNATVLWERIISLPIFSSMSEDEVGYVIETVKRICTANSSQTCNLSTIPRSLQQAATTLR